MQDLLLKNGIRQSKPFFQSVGVFLDRETQNLFKNIKSTGGADQPAYNRTTWKGYSAVTLHPVDSKGFPNTEIWRSRTGTDGSKGQYSASSKMNQKSGFFRKSWGMSELSDRHMVFGSQHPLVYDLIKDRPVINYDAKMKSDFSNLWRGWFRNQIKTSIQVTPA